MVDSFSVNYDPLFLQARLQWVLQDASAADRFVIYCNRESDPAPVTAVGNNISHINLDIISDSIKALTYQIVVIDKNGHEWQGVAAESAISTVGMPGSEVIALNGLEINIK